MESTGEAVRVQPPVVEKVKDTVFSLYEKYARIPVSDEVVTSFDRVAKTFQSEKGKRMIDSMRPYIPTLANMAEGFNAAADLSCGAIGMGFGIKEVVGLRRDIKKTPVPFVVADHLGHYKKLGVGLGKAIVIPTAFAALRPFSRGALYGARGLGSVGEFVGKTVDQMLMRSEGKQKKNVVFTASVKPV